MKKKRKVLFIQCSNSGVAYWRGYAFWIAAHRTNAADWHMLWWQKDLREIHPWQIDVADAVYAARIVKELEAYAITADAIICQMVHTPDALAMLEALKIRCPLTPILAEIDDDITDTPSYNPAFGAYKPGGEFCSRALDQFRQADAMIVSTPHLAEVYREYNKHIYVVPNSIDFGLWGKVRRSRRRGLTIGWAGGASHDEDLRIAEPAIHAILKDFPETRFILVHGAPAFLRGVPRVEHVRKWAPILRYPQHLASQGFDIGIAPLVDNKFNRGKSNLRWLEYSALGVPCVASRVGNFAETIKDGVDGLLAGSPLEFEDCLRRLVSDRRLRSAIGRRAQDRAGKDFNMDKTLVRYMDAIDEVIARGVVKLPPEHRGWAMSDSGPGMSGLLPEEIRQSRMEATA